MQILGHQLIKVKIADLKFDPSNPNEMSEKQMQGLRESMKRFGYLTPIIIDQNGMIADGEHRCLIYKEFGYECQVVKRPRLPWLWVAGPDL